MEGLKLITERIISDAKTKAEAKMAEAKSVVSEIEIKSKEETDKIEALMNEEISKIKKHSKENTAAMLLSQEKEALLKVENEVIAEIIAEAKERVLSMDEKEYFDLIKEIYKKNAEDKEGEILFTEVDKKRMSDGFIKELSDIKGTVKLSPDTLDKPGFVIRYGKVEVNCTFDAIIDDKYQDFIAIASKLL